MPALANFIKIMVSVVALVAMCCLVLIDRHLMGDWQEANHDGKPLSSQAEFGTVVAGTADFDSARPSGQSYAFLRSERVVERLTPFSRLGTGLAIAAKRGCAEHLSHVPALVLRL
jgi:hypothetical protein